MENRPTRLKEIFQLGIDGLGVVGIMILGVLASVWETWSKPNKF